MPDINDSVAPKQSDVTSIWLVDDSKSLRAMLANLLQGENGIDCRRQFSTAEDALDALARETPPDVILLDVRMPGMGGLKAVRPIKMLAPQTHVVMLTTFYDYGSEQNAIADGASALLLKSYSFSRIVEEVRGVVEHGPELFVASDRVESPLVPKKSVANDETLDMERSTAGSVAPARGHFSWRCASQRFVRGAASLRQRVLQSFRKPEVDQDAVLVGHAVESKGF
jgi:DNA-binding NarL/FixJ family response regulator